MRTCTPKPQSWRPCTPKLSLPNHRIGAHVGCCALLLKTIPLLSYKRILIGSTPRSLPSYYSRPPKTWNMDIGSTMNAPFGWEMAICDKFKLPPGHESPPGRRRIAPQLTGGTLRLLKTGGPFSEGSAQITAACMRVYMYTHIPHTCMYIYIYMYTYIHVHTGK